MVRLDFFVEQNSKDSDEIKKWLLHLIMKCVAIKFTV